MSRLVVASLIVVSSVIGATGAYAQEPSGAGPGRLELTVTPWGATHFFKDGTGPSFDTLSAGVSLSYNPTRIIGIEGEVTGNFGYKQDLVGMMRRVAAPNMTSYTANLVIGKSFRSIFPYITGGGGGLTVYKRRDLGLDTNAGSFLVGSVGAGGKWFQSGGRWGLRADYRYQWTGAKTDAPGFFGKEPRHGNRFTGGVIINLLK